MDYVSEMFFHELFDVFIALHYLLQWAIGFFQ